MLTLSPVKCPEASRPRPASRAAIQSLRTFGGYGLTTEYDIHLYNLRAKAWALVHGDPERLLGLLNGTSPAAARTGVAA